MNPRKLICAYTVIVFSVAGLRVYAETPVRKHSADDAVFVHQSVPRVMTAGQEYGVAITMMNSGTAMWIPGEFNLSSQNPRDNDVWGSRIPLTGNASIPHGASVTFESRVKAPSRRGTYNFQWRMAHENVDWFGELTPNVRVKVSVP